MKNKPDDFKSDASLYKTLLQNSHKSDLPKIGQRPSRERIEESHKKPGNKKRIPCSTCEKMFTAKCEFQKRCTRCQNHPPRMSKMVDLLVTTKRRKIHGK